MRPVSTMVKPSADAERAPFRAGDGTRDGARWLIVSGYLLGALLVTARLWADPSGRMPAANGGDTGLFDWWLRYAATAVAHGRLPALVTTALNAPHGVNLMWNTPYLLPGVLLSPVTLLAGPQASLTVVITLGFAGSAAALFWVLRRCGASLTAAGLGGAVYGFSPALVDAGFGHYNFQFAVLPPLMVHALLLIATGRGRPVRTGAGLGLLAAAQLFIGSELLLDTGLAGVVLLAVLAAGHRRAVAARTRNTALGLGAATAVMLLICWYALWVQFYGPFTERYTLPSPWYGNVRLFVTPPGTLLFHTAASAAYDRGFSLGIPEVLAYLGWPLLVVLVVAAIWFWRDQKVRAAAVTWAVLELLALGGGAPRVGGAIVPAWLLPYHWLQGLPVLGELLPNRFSILADGAAAAALAVALDRARAAATQSEAWGRRCAGIPALVAVLAVLPLVPLPYQAAPLAPVPAGWRLAFDRLRLPPGVHVLVIPISAVGNDRSMIWAAQTGQPSSMVGGYFIGPEPDGQPTFNPGPAHWAARYLRRVQAGRTQPGPTALARLRGDLAYWHPAAVVAVTSQASALARVLTGLLGPPTFRAGRVLAWRR